MDLRIVSSYFIEYPERSKNFRFYCPSHTTKIIKIETAKFIEDDKNSRSGEPHNAVLKKIRESFPIIVIPIDIAHK